MNKIRSFLLAICFFAYTCACLAQDMIVTKESKKIDAKVTEVNADNIRYKRFDNLDGPVYTLPKSDILTIVYQNGRVEMFTDPTNAASAQTEKPAVQSNSGAVRRQSVVLSDKDQIKRQKKKLDYFNRVMRGKDFKTRVKYTDLIENDELLNRIAIEHKHSETAIHASNRILNEKNLCEIAIKYGSTNPIGKNAFNRLTDEKMLYDMAIRSLSFRDAATEKITREDLLFKIAHKTSNAKIVSKISDQDILIKIVDSISVIGVRAEAIKKIDDQAYLYHLATTEKENSISTAAINRLNEDMLKKIATESNSENLQRTAIRKITDEQFLLEFVNSSTNERLRLTAFDGITNQQYLSALLDDKLFATRVLAKITDQDLLFKIVQDTQDWDLRKSAFNKLDTASLEKMAAGVSKDKALEVAAKIILNKTSWNAEFSNKSSEQLGRVIGAAALVDHPKPTSASVVSACHTYIRRGDKSRIPELRDLLLRYGDKSLAEDYLNCGNTQLEDAGREWGRRNGYNVGSGYGSHRVRWGSGN